MPDCSLLVVDVLPHLGQIGLLTHGLWVLSWLEHRGLLLAWLHVKGALGHGSISALSLDALVVVGFRARAVRIVVLPQSARREEDRMW